MPEALYLSAVTTRLAVALRAGVDPRTIGLHGNNKSEAEIELALDAGVGRIIDVTTLLAERECEARVEQVSHWRSPSGWNLSRREWGDSDRPPLSGPV